MGTTTTKATTTNPYNHDHAYDQNRAWDEGWVAGYDDNEETWVAQILPIVGELEEHIRYDWENNDCLQVGKIKMIFDVFIQYAPEYDWLEGLVKDAVQAYKDHGWDDLSYGDLQDLQIMAKAFGVPMTKKWRVTVTWSDTFEVEAVDEGEACIAAEDKIREDSNWYDVLANADFEAEEDTN
jgi:hypothetical protein